MAKVHQVSPLAPKEFPNLPVINGVRFATAETGIKYKGRPDVLLVTLDPGTSVAGAFTKSATQSAAVLDCQSKIGGASDTGAAILVNSGNANAFTGRNGMEAVKAITSAVAERAKIPSERVFTSSTGVIGVPLNPDQITQHLDALASRLDVGGIASAAQAILTTDTFPKGASKTIHVQGKPVQIAGIAKGSGMIAPDMATMLVYVFTDALIDQSALQDTVADINAKTFNCITVDSDTSTSDTLLVGATGASGVDVSGTPEFAQALHDVMLDLAHQVVRDGEGATKFIQISVTGAATDHDAKTHAMAIANSPLVKTAIAGEDPNWGRIVMAVGKSGAAADRDTLTIRFGNVLVAENGWISPSYREEDGVAHMKQDDIHINVDLGMGAGQSTVWTCDLTHGYISINADYRS